MLRFVECSDESEEYDEYDSEESNENAEYDSDESYYYSSDSYEEYPQSNVLNESNGKNREGEKEKEDEEGDYDDYEYDDYEYNEEEGGGEEKDQKTFVEPAGTSEPLQVPNVNEVSKNEEYDDYYYYDDDDEYDEDEEAFVEANGANDPSGEDYEYSSYEDEKNGPIEDGDDDNYDSYSEEEEWEEAPAAATSQLPIRK